MSPAKRRNPVDILEQGERDSPALFFLDVSSFLRFLSSTRPKCRLLKDPHSRTNAVVSPSGHLDTRADRLLSTRSRAGTERRRVVVVVVVIATIALRLYILYYYYNERHPLCVVYILNSIYLSSSSRRRANHREASHSALGTGTDGYSRSASTIRRGVPPLKIRCSRNPGNIEFSRSVVGRVVCVVPPVCTKNYSYCSTLL